MASRQAIKVGCAVSIEAYLLRQPVHVVLCIGVARGAPIEGADGREPLEVYKATDRDPTNSKWHLTCEVRLAGSMLRKLGARLCTPLQVARFTTALLACAFRHEHGEPLLTTDLVALRCWGRDLDAGNPAMPEDDKHQFDNVARYARTLLGSTKAPYPFAQVKWAHQKVSTYALTEPPVLTIDDQNQLEAWLWPKEGEGKTLAVEAESIPQHDGGPNNAKADVNDADRLGPSNDVIDHKSTTVELHAIECLGPEPAKDDHRIDGNVKPATTDRVGIVGLSRRVCDRSMAQHSWKSHRRLLLGAARLLVALLPAGAFHADSVYQLPTPILTGLASLPATGTQSAPAALTSTSKPKPLRVVLSILPHDQSVDIDLALDAIKEQLTFRATELRNELQQASYSPSTIPNLEFQTKRSATSPNTPQTAGDQPFLEISGVGKISSERPDANRSYYLTNFVLRIDPSQLSHPYVRRMEFTITPAGQPLCDNIDGVYLCEQTFPLLNAALGARSRSNQFRHFAARTDFGPTLRILDYSLHGELGAFELQPSAEFWVFRQSAPVSIPDVAAAVNTFAALHTIVTDEYQPPTDTNADVQQRISLALLKRFIGDTTGNTLLSTHPNVDASPVPPGQEAEQYPLTQYARAIASLVSAQLLRFELNTIGLNSQLYSNMPEVAKARRLLVDKPRALSAFRSFLEPACMHGSEQAVHCKITAASFAHANGLLTEAFNDLFHASQLVSLTDRITLLHYAAVYAEFGIRSGEIRRETVLDVLAELSRNGAYAIAEFELAKLEYFGGGVLEKAKAHWLRVLELRPRHALTRFLLALLAVGHEDADKLARRWSSLVDDLNASNEHDEDLFSLGPGDGVIYALELREVLSAQLAWLHARCAHGSFDEAQRKATSLPREDLDQVRVDARDAPVRCYHMIPLDQCLKVGLIGPCSDSSNPQVSKFLEQLAEQ
jgi:hypothetical protein